MKTTKTVKLILKPLISLLSYKSIVILFSSLSYILEELHVNEVFQYKTEDIEHILQKLNEIESSLLWNKEELIYQFLIRLNFLIDTRVDKDVQTNYNLLMFVLKSIFFEIEYFHKICNYFALNRWNVLFTSKKDYIFSKKRMDFFNESKPFYPIISSLQNTGFRIVCGRARNTGFGTIAINPVIPLLLKFLAIGDQIRLSDPFDTYQVQVNESLEGPYVQLADQSCIRINSLEQLNKHAQHIENILSLGELLIDEFDIPGSFSNQSVTVSHFSWVVTTLNIVAQIPEDQRSLLIDIFNSTFDPQSNTSFLRSIRSFLVNELNEITAYRSVELYKHFRIPIHPRFTPRWGNISNKDWRLLRSWTRKTRYKETALNGFKIHQILGDFDSHIVEMLMKSEIPFVIENDKITIEEYGSILHYIFLDKNTDLAELEPGESSFNPLIYLNNSNKINFFLTESFKVHASLNSINSVYVDSIKENIHGFYLEPSNNEELTVVNSTIDELDVNLTANLPGGNEDQRIELLKKTIFRAKHNLNIFKDGLIHFSVINTPLSVFKAREFNISVEQLHRFGYFYDIHGQKVTSTNQEILLKPSDIIIPKSLISEIIDVLSFINDEMKFIFNNQSFYDLSKGDSSIIGVNVIGINKNFSVGVYGRIIGFSDLPVCFAAPIWHLSKGSYCNGEMTDSFVIDTDCFLNLDLSLLVSKVGMFRGIPIFTQIEPDLDIATASLDKILIEHAYKGRKLEFLTQSQDNPTTTGIITNLLNYNLYKNLSDSFIVENISKYFEKNILTGISDPIDRLIESLAIQMKLKTLDINKIYNNSIISFIDLVVLQDINTFFKNAFISSIFICLTTAPDKYSRKYIITAFECKAKFFILITKKLFSSN